MKAVLQSFSPCWPAMALVCCGFLTWSSFASEKPIQKETTTDAESKPFPDPYNGTAPDFVESIKKWRGWSRDEKQMELSSEKSFFTLNLVNEDSRAYALIEAGERKESEGQYREALKIYQELFDKILSINPHVLYRVSQYGVFVPLSQYVQRRILKFPAEDLAYYRTLHDARAKEMYENARSGYSLSGLSEIVDNLMASSYGDNALLDLGNAALDMGFFLEAHEYFVTVRDFFSDSEANNDELALRIAYCEKMMGAGGEGGLEERGRSTQLKVEDWSKFKQVVAAAKPEPDGPGQLASAPYPSADDYLRYPPSDDPLGLREPAWRHELPDSRKDLVVYTQPTVTDTSVIYRHKNIVYCRSILNGQLRWTNDLGGRVKWQSVGARKYPAEEVVVQDGLVFTNMYKGGPSLVALSEATGQLVWSYGPMAPGTEEEVRMRFEATPACGPRSVYAGYVLDNIEGETHTDTEYGIVAFDSVSGRIQWRKPLCRLTPEKFSGGLTQAQRNRIRSFSSPPLYHQGTLYYTTNAGVAAALDARSGRVKWLMRYPYFPGVHDATREWGGYEHHDIAKLHHSPMFWRNQRPFLDGDRLYMLPVDSRMMLCLDRRSGRVLWHLVKGTKEFRRYRNGQHVDGGIGYFAGKISTGELVFVYRARGDGVRLVDPQTGAVTWSSPDLLMEDKSVSMNAAPQIGQLAGIELMAGYQQTTARPFLTEDDRLIVTSVAAHGCGHYGLTIGYAYNLCVLDLKERQVLEKRRFYDSTLSTMAEHYITVDAPNALKSLEATKSKDKKVLLGIEIAKNMMAETPPTNVYGPFMPFSRVTFSRYGTNFELRVGPRSIELLFDQGAAEEGLAKRDDPAALFARAELAITDAAYNQAVKLLESCLDRIHSDDVDFRAVINQQLYQVHRELARAAIRSGRPDDELAHCRSMRSAAGTVQEQMETLFALSEAHARKGAPDIAARSLQAIVNRYGHFEYPVATTAGADFAALKPAAEGVLDGAARTGGQSLLGEEFTTAAALLKKSLPLYASSIAPLPKQLNVRAGEFAARKLAGLLKAHPEFQQSFNSQAQAALDGKTPEERFYRLPEFPAAAAAQKTLRDMFDQLGAAGTPEKRRQVWALADLARMGNLNVPQAMAVHVHAPAQTGKPTPITRPAEVHTIELPSEEGTAWLVLDRKDDGRHAPNLLFVGGRVKKRLDNKFILTCFDADSGKEVWTTGPKIRLRGLGEESGFFDAYVLQDLVVVHGLYDVLAFNLKDGKPRWRYRAPFDFEISHASLSGDLLVLAGQAETMALYLRTGSPNGEVAWQVKEEGSPYQPPFFDGDRLVAVRKSPFNLTVRYRGTGILIGRLALPDLSLETRHPLMDDGPEALPYARDGSRLLLTDGWYLMVVDAAQLKILWKRLIPQNDLSQEPAMRMALSGKYVALVKENFDRKAIYMYDAQSGSMLWQTDPANAKSPYPLYDMMMDGDMLYGLAPHPGQGFYVVARDATSGKDIYRKEVKEYEGKPVAGLEPRMFDGTLVVRVKERQQYELRVFEAQKGVNTHTLELKGAGELGRHGRVSYTIQHGRAILLSKSTLKF